MGIGSFLLGLWPQRRDRDNTVVISGSTGHYKCTLHGVRSTNGQWKKLGDRKWRAPCGCTVNMELRG